MNINGSLFRNQIIKSNTPKNYNLISPKNNNKQNRKIFLGASLKSNKNNNKEKKLNYRYKNYDINLNAYSGRINFLNFLTPRSDSKISKFIIKESEKNYYKNLNKSIDNNEKCFILNNNLLEYNSIIALLSKILIKSNSYILLSKIKNFIKKLIFDKNESVTLNNSYYKDYISPNESRPLSSNKNANISERKEIKKNKEEIEKNDENKSKSKSKNQKKNKKINEINYFLRKIKKLNQKINELEEKCRIEQLKYLFYIIEQEKKIAELEKSFDINQIPLDEKIIEKMKELKCLPNYYKPDANEEIKKNKKRPPLSSKIRNVKNNNNSNFRSRNKNNTNIKNKYSFDKEIDPIIKRNQSQILNKRNENKYKKAEYINDVSRSKSKNMNCDDSNEIFDMKKRNSNNYSRPVNQLFTQKKFFISHPKLRYVKDSQEKNHFQKLKTKEQLNGISKLLSNINYINLGSKFQKSAVNDFSYFINNSMVNVEKLKGYNNYINLENKFEESLKLKRKPSL